MDGERREAKSEKQTEKRRREAGGTKGNSNSHGEQRRLTGTGVKGKSVKQKRQGGVGYAGGSETRPYDSCGREDGE